MNAQIEFTGHKSDIFVKRYINNSQCFSLSLALALHRVGSSLDKIDGKQLVMVAVAVAAMVAKKMSQ